MGSHNRGPLWDLIQRAKGRKVVASGVTAPTGEAPGVLPRGTARPSPAGTKPGLGRVNRDRGNP